MHRRPHILLLSVCGKCWPAIAGQAGQASKQQQQPIALRYRDVAPFERGALVMFDQDTDAL